MYSPAGHPRCRWVWFFRILRNLAFLRTVYNPKQSKYVLNKYADWFWCERTREDGWFFTGENVNIEHDWYFSQKQRFKFNNLFMIGLFIRNMQPFTSLDINWWTVVVLITCFYQLFGLSFWLQRIYWWTSDGMLHFSVHINKTNSSTSWMAWGWIHFHKIYIMGELFL